jgi:hypothetical protein
MFANATNQVGIAQRVVATLVACAVVLMSIGFYHNAQAANLHHVSDVLSDSDGAVSANHTITFTSPTGVPNGQSIIIDFSDGPFVNPGSAVDFTDVDVATTSDYTIAANCAGSERISAVFSAGPILTLTFCAGDGGFIPANGTTTIQIGTNATFGTTGNAQLTNPAAGVSYEIVVTAGTADTGRTRVAIVDDVLVSAIVNTTFDFTVSGLATSTETWAGLATTTGSTTATTIPFGELVAGVAETLGQGLNVQTNARNGFAVTVHTDGNFRSANGAVIDNFDQGSDVAQTNVVWNSPVPNVNDETSWGHWGVNSNDADLNSLGGFYSSEFAYNEYIAASTTPRTVYHHDGPADNTTQNIGNIELSYRVEITALQEAADDYQTVLTYVATPIF